MNVLKGKELAEHLTFSIPALMHIKDNIKDSLKCGCGPEVETYYRGYALDLDELIKTKQGGK